jgi:hypothetical protein
MKNKQSQLIPEPQRLTLKDITPLSTGQPSNLSISQLPLCRHHYIYLLPTGTNFSAAK